MLKNTVNSYGLVSKFLHWLAALTVFSLFGLGVWMVDLTYYDSWYKSGPDLHRSIGILLIIITLIRLVVVTASEKPRPLSTHRPWIVVSARLVHALMYVLIFLIGASGYLMSTADGRSVEVFNGFSIPSAGEWLDRKEDIAGAFHQWLAYTLIGVAVVHALAAFKHHLIDGDSTLKRMF